MKIFLIILFIFSSFCGFGAEKKNPKKVNRPVVKESNQATEILDASLDYIDQTQQLIADSWRGLNYNVDSFFSDKRYQIEDNKSKVMFYWVGHKSESQAFENAFDFAIKIHLPQTTKHLSVTLAKERNEIFDATNSQFNRNVNRTSGGTGGTAESQNSYAATANYILFKNPIWKTSFKTGMKLLLPLDPFTKLNIFNDHKWKYFHLGASQNFMLYRQDGFKEMTSLNFGIPVSKDFYISQNNVLAWEDRTDLFNLRNDLSFGYAIDDKRGVSQTFGANALLSPTLYYVGYDAALSYRQLLFRDWFFGALTVGSEFLKRNDFKQSSFIQVRFDIL